MICLPRDTYRITRREFLGRDFRFLTTHHTKSLESPLFIRVPRGEVYLSRPHSDHTPTTLIDFGNEQRVRSECGLREVLIATPHSIKCAVLQLIRIHRVWCVVKTAFLSLKCHPLPVKGRSIASSGAKHCSSEAKIKTSRHRFEDVPTFIPRQGCLSIYKLSCLVK